MAETLTLNGVDLSTLVSNVESVASLLRTPPRRGLGLSVPGRHGHLRLADRVYDPVDFEMPFFVLGVDDVTGAALRGDAAVTAYYAAADALLLQLHAPVLEFDHGLPDGTVRRTVAELADEVMDFTRQQGSPLFGRVTAPLWVPDAFRVDPTVITVPSFALATGGTRTLVEFAGATAPMADLSITFTGPINNPELHQTATDSFVAYDGVIGSGQSLTIHCDDLADPPLVGTGGLVPDYTKLRYLPPRWFELNPAAGLTVSLVHTGGGSASCSISGHRRFLTG